MACGSGGCSTGGCGGGCSSGGCNKLNTYNWLDEMELPPHMKPFDIVEVRFKGTRKEFYRNPHNIEAFVNELVVVEAEGGGLDIGKISLKGELVKLQLKKAGKSEDDPTIKKIVRKANEIDISRYKENKELEVPTMYRARSIAMELGLTMKLSDVEYQGDRRKATFYYTAEDRVDFRELIKRLADAFKVRVEMRQIGYRQEAGRLGGIGSCGRELCCSTWLTDFKLVHTNAARYQNLSINQLKLSGQCGKLKCCLNFELDQYLESLKDFPETDQLSLYFADDLTLHAVKTDILKRIIFFASNNPSQTEWISFDVETVNALIALNKAGEKPLFESYKPTPKQQKVVLEEIDFKNDMGIDSLTRLDERDRNSKKKQLNSNKNYQQPKLQNQHPSANNNNGKNPSKFRNKNRKTNNKPQP
jgi:cell fate regulator YaaT (PSP1 superfamily)